jgi:hypothetical protein
MHSVAMFPVFTGPAYANMADTTISLRLQFFQQLVNGRACFLNFLSGMLSRIGLVTKEVCLVEGVDISQHDCRNWLFSSSGRYCQNKQCRRDYEGFHDLSLGMVMTK